MDRTFLLAHTKLILKKIIILLENVDPTVRSYWLRQYNFKKIIILLEYMNPKFLLAHTI